MKLPAYFCSLFLLWCLHHFDLSFGDECEYKESTCKVNPGQCDYLPPDCEGMGYPDLYSNRKEEKFHAYTIKPEFYADDATITVISTIEWKEDGSYKSTWTALPECCGLKWNETCNLRPREGKEQFIIIAPMSDGDFCYKSIQEFPVHKFGWCKHIGEVNCYYLQQGKIYLSKRIEDATTDNIAADYCYFPAPEKYLETGTDQNNSFIMNIQNITMDEKNLQVSWESTTANCTIWKGQNEGVGVLIKNENIPEGRAACFFYKAPNTRAGWSDTPFCLEHDYEVTDEFVPVIKSYLFVLWICIGVTAGALPIIIVSVWIYRTKYRQCCPSYNETKKEIPKTGLSRMTEEGQKLLPNHDDKGGREEQIYFIEHTNAKTVNNNDRDIKYEDNKDDKLPSHTDSGIESNTPGYTTQMELQIGSDFVATRQHPIPYEDESIDNVNVGFHPRVTVHTPDHVGDTIGRDASGEILQIPLDNSANQDTGDSGFDSDFKNERNHVEKLSLRHNDFPKERKLELITVMHDCNTKARSLGDDLQYITKEQAMRLNEHKNSERRSTVRKFSVESTTSSLPPRSSTSSSDTGCESEKNYEIPNATKYRSENNIAHYVKQGRPIDSGFENENWENITCYEPVPNVGFCDGYVPKF